MPEQLLHTLYVGPIVEHCRRKRVAQHMRRLFFHCCDKRQLFSHYALHLSPLYAFSLFCHEEGAVGLTLPFQLITHFHISLHRSFQLLSERHDPLFVAFTCDRELKTFITHIIIIKSDQVGGPNTRGLDE